MFTKKEIMNVLKKQLSLDYNCQTEDFENNGNIITENKLIEGRRIYESDGCYLKIVCVGGKAIISSDSKIKPWLEEKLLIRDANWLFEYPKLRLIDNKLNEFGHEIDDMHHYYLPIASDVYVEPLTPIRWFEQEEILQFDGDNRFSEAFAFDANNPDMLAVAALDGDKIMGMAGASKDCETLWQIGINVLTEYRGKGIGSNLVALLKQEILKRGVVPFYGTVISHMHSQNIAINAGFFPAWVEIFTKETRNIS